MSYQKYPLFNGEEIPFIKRKSDNASIPFDEANSDYQEYLKWLNGEDPYTEKGTPEAAD
tara:strand:- start:29 stop:205 length:177 start_codon:yes stop_codon:yes gene_type:complete